MVSFPGSWHLRERITNGDRKWPICSLAETSRGSPNPCNLQTVAVPQLNTEREDYGGDGWLQSELRRVLCHVLLRCDRNRRYLVNPRNIAQTERATTWQRHPRPHVTGRSVHSDVRKSPLFRSEGLSVTVLGSASGSMPSFDFHLFTGLEVTQESSFPLCNACQRFSREERMYQSTWVHAAGKMSVEMKFRSLLRLSIRCWMIVRTAAVSPPSHPLRRMPCGLAAYGNCRAPAVRR